MGTGQRGVTLIELLVVLAIIAILLLTALSFVGWSQRYSTETTARQMYAEALSVRARALQRKRVHWIAVTAGGYTVYEDTDPQPDGDGVLTPGADAIVSETALGGGLTLAWGGGDEIEIDTRGLLSGVNLVRVVSDAPADQDCFSTTPTELILGQWNGAICVEK